MILVVLFIGILLIVAAVRNSHKTLFQAVGQDVPDFIVWAAAILAIGALGFIPGLKPASRGLLALVIVVLVLNNYQNIVAGFSSTWKNQVVANKSGNTVHSSVAAPSQSSGTQSSSQSSDINASDVASAFEAYYGE
jgi:hypothetical protein